MKRKGVIFGVCALAVIACTVLFNFVQAVGSDPGSETDPLISESYLEGKLADLKTYIDTKLGEGAGGQGTVFAVVNMQTGTQIVCEGGTEVILRAGKATAVVSDQGGLSDVTGGKDIAQGESIPMNHLLIIPRSDGRGMTAKADCVLMIKGKYELKSPAP